MLAAMLMFLISSSGSQLPEAVESPVSNMMAMVALAILVIVVVRILGWGLNSAKAKGARGERIVAGRLRRGLPEGYRMLNDVYLPLRDGTTTQIDHVVVSEFGVFVVETKNYSGWIFGSEDSAKWTQTIYRTKNSFQNPIRQNYRHICALSETLHIPKNLLIGVVAFTGDCEFKTEMPRGVVYSRWAARYIKSFDEPRIKKSQVDEIVLAIEEWQKRVSEEQKGAHVLNLKIRHSPAGLEGQTPRCPRCGGEMVLRARRSDGGQFYGCKSFPACRGIVPIR